MKLYANIIIEISAVSLDRVFSYYIPENIRNEIKIGSVVSIPFGVSNNERIGYVVGFTDSINFNKSKVKSIIKVNSNINIESELIRIAYWMKERYLCTLQTALKSMIPSNKNIKKVYNRYIKKNVSNEQIGNLLDSLSNNKRYDSRRRALKLLLTTDFIEEKLFISTANTTKNILQTLESNNIITVYDKERYRDPFAIDKIKATENLSPNENQFEAIETIINSVDGKKNDIFLLHGITGSGKTEVYMQIIENVIKQGQQAIVLIPEIALTPQTVNRFIGRFGNIVGVIHSNLSQGEKYDQWRKAKEQKISIMIGARSAIFAPFSDLGIIIIDEEHEMTYKSEMPPKYHAREVAIKRSSINNCPVVLGTATPLIETYYKAMEGKYKLIELNNKAIQNSSLDVEIVDMRQELVNGNKSVFSEYLKEQINCALERKEQVILFINRRGHSRFVSCRKCGYVVKCPNCDIPYTYHSYDENLMCHYCGNSMEMVKVCPSCKSKYIKEFGTGTQKVEIMVKNEFKNAKVLRMDFDTTTTKNSYKKILGDFEKHKADILIGTQMVAKGHHFENVTVVGVLAADLSLYINDFRACERTFQLCTQVTGRTGRGNKAGKAIIQTYSPDHYSIICAKEQNYRNFYDNEIQYRRLMNYPPFSNIAVMLLSSTIENELIKDSFSVNEYVKKLIGNNEIEILGPSPANLSKVKNIYRRKIIFKAKEYRLLTNFIKKFYSEINKENIFSNINIQFDINPMISH
jgi:primosomal protein N' (replication factor Y)